MLKKGYQVCLFMTACILLNYGLKMTTANISIPFWLDSVGTAIAAYVLGPACGAIAGATVNITFGISDPVSLLYAITNIAVGITIGICARKKMMERFFDVITASAFVTLIAALISTTINCMLYHGSTGNEWGDGILMLLEEWQVNWVLASFIAEYFLDFLDKFATLVILYVLIMSYRGLRKTVRRLKSERAESLEKTENFNEGEKVTTVRSFFPALFPISLVTAVAASAATLAATALATASLAGITSMAFPIKACAKEVQKEQEAREYPTYIQTVYSNNNGLMSGEANDIASADNGIIWIGTYAGLYRYSGSDFRYVNYFDTVKNVNCLYVDVEGRLWIGTNDDGLSICIEEQVVNTFNEDSGFPSNSIRSIVQCSDGNYYVGTSDSLVVLSLVGGAAVKNTFSDINYTSDLTADKMGHVAAVTSAGKLFLLDETGVIDERNGFDGVSFSCCKFGKDGKLYVGDYNGTITVFSVNKGKLSKEEIISVDGLNYINSIQQIENGDFFVCADEGIGWFDAESHRINLLNTGSFNSSIDRMTVDYQGNLWFSSSRLGVMKLCPSAFMEVYPEANLESVVVNTIAEWNGKLYFGTDSGLDVIRKESSLEMHTDLGDYLGNARIRCLKVDSHNQLWVCANNFGVLCVTKDGEITQYTSKNGMLGNYFRSTLELSDGTIAAASDKGVSFIKNGKVTGVVGAEDGLTNSLVLSLLELNDGRVLVGTDGGGIGVIVDGKLDKMLTRADGLGSGVVLRMIKDTDNDNVFIATSNGISYMEKDDAIRELKYFPYSNNYDMYDDGNGKFYATGSAGIYVVEKSDLLGRREMNYENLNYRSGLRGTFTANAWNYIDESGYWYIAGGAGVTKFNLNTYSDKTSTYRMVVNSVILDDTIHYLHGEKSFSVARGVSNLQISPEIINYSSKEPFICYYMEGLGNEERTIVLQDELDTIVYGNLAAGTYKFHLSILDSAKGEPIEEQVYTITKEAEIYDYLWFKMYFFAELIFIVAWMSWFITRTVTAKKLEYQRREIELAKEQVRLGNETILAIARTVDAKDENTSQHSTRVAQYSVMIGKRLGYTEEEQESLRKTALLHDIGKIGIPDRVLNKPAALTDDEYVIMKSHVTRGAEILKDFTLIPHVQEGALYHHERYDGSGYAQGLKGKEIPETARIIGIADAFDAMTANRVYRKKLAFDTVLSEMKKGSGKQFDPDILAVFLKLIEDGTIREEDLYREEETQV